MAATLRIDTLSFARRLTDAGLDRKVAEAIVEGLSEADTSDLATKPDVAAVRSELQDVKSELQSRITEVKAELQLSIAETKAELLRFMLVQAITIVGLTVTLLKLLP